MGGCEITGIWGQRAWGKATSYFYNFVIFLHESQKEQTGPGGVLAGVEQARK
jgi:hypothetical protein